MSAHGNTMNSVDTGTRFLTAKHFCKKLRSFVVTATLKIRNPTGLSLWHLFWVVLISLHGLKKEFNLSY